MADRPSELPSDDAHFVYGFVDAHGIASEDRKRLLGGKGAGLADMTELGLPVPPGFTITTAACRAYLHNGALPPQLAQQVEDALAELEARMGRRIGDPSAPLLLSVRSGAPVSMPGMMDTVLNLGLTPEVADGLAGLFDDERFALDGRRRFLESYGSVVMGVDMDVFSHAVDTVRAQLPHEDEVAVLRRLVDVHRDLVTQHAGATVPLKPRDQLLGAIEAVFHSWNSPRAKVYRELEGIDDDLGTAVTVQAMVFGNLDDSSGTGVAFTRNPNTGERQLYGDFLFRAQGEDVVSGRHETLPLAALGERLPRVYTDLVDACELLERRARDMCDIEFTVEGGTLYLLQTRRGKRAAVAHVRIAVDMAQEGLITRDESVERITATHIARLDRPYIDPTTSYEVLATGLNASPGLATGRICLSPDDVLDMSDDASVILVRTETSPSDVHGMALASGILTSRGGLVSHAAVVARDMGTPAVVGVSEVTIDEKSRTVRIGTVTLGEGDIITIDGTTGEVVQGGVASLTPSQSEHLETLLAWADEIAGADAVPDRTPWNACTLPTVCWPAGVGMPRGLCDWAVALSGP